jgi:hypothetical protein
MPNTTAWTIIGEHGTADLAFKQGGCLGDVANLSGGDDEAQRSAERIGHM